MVRPLATTCYDPDMTTLYQVQERGKKVLANIIAQQEGLITRHRVQNFVRKLGTEASVRNGGPTGRSA